MVNINKVQKVQSLQDLLKKHNNFILLKVGKIKHQKLEQLRKILKKHDAYLKVSKNTLFEKTFNKLGAGDNIFSDFRKKALPLKDGSALMTLSPDWSKAINDFYQFVKEEKTINFKIGVLDNQIYTEEILTQIAKLPPKNELFAKLIGSLKSPTNKIVYSLKYNIQKLTLIFKAKSVKK